MSRWDLPVEGGWGGIFAVKFGKINKKVSKY
jgi:hypothetical protein